MTTFRKTGKVYQVTGSNTRHRLEEIYRMIASGKLSEGTEIEWYDLFDRRRYTICVVNNGAMVLKSKLKVARQEPTLRAVSLSDIYEWMKQHDPVTPQQLYEYVYGPGFNAIDVERLLDRLERHGYAVSENKQGMLYAAEPVHSYRARGVLFARMGN